MVIKCGEIFFDKFNESAQYCVIFVCDCCHGEYFKLKEFLKHLEDKRSQDEAEKESIGESISAITVNDETLIEVYNCPDENEESIENSTCIKQIADANDEFSAEEFTSDALLDEDNTDETLSFKGSMDTFNNMDSNETVYCCAQCKENFHLYNEYANHQCYEIISLAQTTQQAKRERKVKSNNYVCAKCKKVCKTKHGLKVHENTHLTNKPYQCDRCAASYADKGNLMDHIRRHTGEKPYKCQYCPSKFVTSTERRIHERTHTGEKPFTCEECERTFTTSSHLKKHQLMAHLDERNYPCNLCDKKFHSAPNLRKHHMNIHMELPRIHECDICEAAFKTIKQLKVHKQIHLPHRYKCQICNKTFAHYAGLYSHRKTHKNKSVSIAINDRT